MKMMGLRGWLHWSAWYIDFFSFNLISCALMTIIFSISTSSGKVLPFSDPSIIFILLVIYVNSVICCNFAISTLFSKSKIVVIHILWTLTFFSKRCNCYYSSISYLCRVTITLLDFYTDQLHCWQIRRSFGWAAVSDLPAAEFRHWYWLYAYSDLGNSR